MLITALANYVSRRAICANDLMMMSQVLCQHCLPLTINRREMIDRQTDRPIDRQTDREKDRIGWEGRGERHGE